MRSERTSRVCIVVLEEVEDDEPSPSPAPAPVARRAKGGRERVSQRAPRPPAPSAHTQEEKVSRMEM